MKKKYFLLSIFMCLLLFDKNVFASENSNIPDDAVEFSGHYYKLYELNISWEDAQEYFQSIGGHLATITTAEENNFVFEYITSLGYQSAYFGATDKESEGTWVWVTGEEFLYNNWHNNEPNNEGRNENYAMFYYKYSDGTWNDGGINTVNAKISKTPYICEWDNIIVEEFNTNDNQGDESYTKNAYEDNNNIDNHNNTFDQNNNKNEDINIKLDNENDNYGENKYTVVFKFHDLNIIGGGLSIFGGISVIGGLTFSLFRFISKKRNNNNTKSTEE